jgi:Putative DNA-binding domain
VLLPSIRRLALADLDEETLRELVDHGEDLLVERKQDLPAPPRFGAAAASFANTLGGWILLGVGDDKKLHGYQKPPNLDLQSYLADVLRKECDPLPPFVADIRELDRTPIAVLRVFESTDPPHIVRGTGAVYVRTSNGKEPVDDHRTLLDLARRGADAELRARDRLVNEPLIQTTFTPPDGDPKRIARDPDRVVVMVRAAPLTRTPQFADWPISESGGAHACREAAEELLPLPDVPPQVGPAARGVVVSKSARVQLPEKANTVLVAADSGGVVAVAIRKPVGEGGLDHVVETDQLRRLMIDPPLSAVAKILTTAEAYGRAAFDTWICLPGDVVVKGGRKGREIHIAGELTIPADDEEIRGLGLQWEREFARSFASIAGK